MTVSALFLFPFFGLGLVMYFLPSIVAFARSKRDTASIVLLNFFLGWTMIGWVVALVWAFKTDVHSDGALRSALDPFLSSAHLSAGPTNAAPEAAGVSVYSSPQASFSSAA